MTGTQLRDLGLARIEQAHPDFLTAARKTMDALIRLQGRATIDEVRDILAAAGIYPDSNHAWGAVPAPAKLNTLREGEGIMTHLPGDFDHDAYLVDADRFSPDVFFDPGRELCEFHHNAEDLAVELAYTRYYLAKEEAKNAELVAVLVEAVEWLEDDRFDDDYITENWYHAALAVLPEPIPEPPQEVA